MCGYDMHWEKRDPEETAAVEAARALFQARAAERDLLPKEEAGALNTERAKAEGLDWDSDEAHDGRSERYSRAQKAVHEAYEAMYAAEKSYFRVNIWGMRVVRDLLETFKMAHDIDHGPFPRPAAYGLTDNQAYAAESPEDYPEEFAKLTPDQLAKGNEYARDSEAALAQHPGETPGIPMFKLGSNDGWLVTPEEAAAAVAAWEGYTREASDDKVTLVRRMIDKEYSWERWEQWVEFLRGATEHGGFRVH